MKVTYEKQYIKKTEGVDWILYSDVGMKDSLIVWALQGVVRCNEMIHFHSLFFKLKRRYEKRTEKSRCSIDLVDNRIEIITRGVFPRFYVEKTK